MIKKSFTHYSLHFILHKREKKKIMFFGIA